MQVLKNVIDTRTGLFHSVAVVKEKNARYFVPQETETPKKSTKKKGGVADVDSSISAE